MMVIIKLIADDVAYIFCTNKGKSFVHNCHESMVQELITHHVIFLQRDNTCHHTLYNEFSTNMEKISERSQASPLRIILFDAHF